MADVEEAGELYGLPLAEFTAARNALAARLRQQGDRAGSGAVKALAKPSTTAWALNQVARGQPALVEGLLATGQDLARAQQRLLAGQGQAAFRDAARAEKEALTRLVAAAAAELGTPGKPILDRLEATARAAAGDPEGGELMRAGRLAADLDPTGFGAGGFEPPAPPIPFPRRQAGREHEPHPPRAEAATDQRREPEEPPRSTRASLVQQRPDRAREEVPRLQRALEALRDEAGQAEGEAARARQAAGEANRALAAARKAAAQAELLAAKAVEAEARAADDLAAVRARLDATAAELRQAQEELRKLRS